MKWIKLVKYCEVTGDTPDAFQARRRRGVWIEGLQFTKAPDGTIWINTDEVDKWVEQQSSQSCHGVLASAN